MALYHKYRPQQFSDVVGQDHIITTITNQITNNKVAHAYLFSGPRGVGKTTIARLLAKAINGKKVKGSTFEPDSSDPAVIEISESRSIDVIEIDAASHTGVDNVRENIIENAQFKPTSLPYKVFIIDEVHMLSTSAFNALLKTLEEPPAHVIFILATTELHKLPETIISRCQRFTFKKVGYAQMKEQLEMIAKHEKISIEPTVLDRIINKGDGCVRDAVSLLDQLMASGDKKITEETASLVLPTSHIEQTMGFMSALCEKNAQSALALLQTHTENGLSMPQFATDLLELERYLLLVIAAGKEYAPTTDINTETQEKLATLATTLSHADIVQLIDLTMKRKQQIQTAPLPELPLEMLVVEWCSSTDQRPKETSTRAVSSESPSIAAPTKTSTPQIKKRTETLVSEKPTVLEKVKEIVTGKNFESLDEVRAKWPEVLSQVEENHPSLSFILKMSALQGVHGHTIELSVPYSFHKDKLESPSCTNQIGTILENVFGKNIVLSIVVQEVELGDEQGSELHELAAAFGGEIVS